MRVAKDCIAALPPSSELVADKGYDSDELRQWLAERGTRGVHTAQTPSQSQARLRHGHLQAAQRHRTHVLSLQGLAAYCHPF